MEHLLDHFPGPYSMSEMPRTWTPPSIGSAVEKPSPVSLGLEQQHPSLLCHDLLQNDEGFKDLSSSLLFNPSSEQYNVVVPNALAAEPSGGWEGDERASSMTQELHAPPPGGADGLCKIGNEEGSPPSLNSFVKSMDEITLDDLDDLIDIPIVMDDHARINNLPYAEIFDPKRELGFMTPRLTRASWGHEEDDEAEAPDEQQGHYRSGNEPIATCQQEEAGTFQHFAERHVEYPTHPAQQFGAPQMWDIPRAATWSLASSAEWPGGSGAVSHYRARSNSDVSSLPSRDSTSSLKRSLNESPRSSEAQAGKSKKVKQKSIMADNKTLEGAGNEKAVDGATGQIRSSNHSVAKPKAPLVGEHRLKIHFISLGTIGSIPQHFGKKRCRIPDGLAGTHELYNQKWQFEVHHRPVSSDVTTINWRITNLASGTIIERTETPHEAFIREYKGQTICNQILRDALDIRARELEAGLNDRPAKAPTNIQTSLKALRPRKCIMGLLFFGLLHQCVQANLSCAEKEKTS